jgi:hypothetical protein
MGRFGTDPGVPFFKQDFTTSFPNEEVEACLHQYDLMVEAAKEFAPDVIITVIGPSGCASIPGRGKRVQAFCANYCAPVVSVWNALPEIPRVCILNDPRNIIRLHELEVWPSAILSQTNSSTQFRVADTNLIRHYRYHKVQNWGLPDVSFGDNSVGVAILAHRHDTDPRVSRNREEVWAYIDQLLEGERVYRHGRGWPEGPITDVKSFLQRHRWGPMIPIADGWVTAKFGQYARYGCCPRPYDAGGYLTYDSQYLMIPEGHPLRWNGGNQIHHEWIHMAVEMTEPDFSSLDNVLSDYKSLPNYEVYGGYQVV